MSRGNRKSGKRNMNQPLPQSGKLGRYAINRHYSGACQCRTCRRLRRKAGAA